MMNAVVSSNLSSLLPLAVTDNNDNDNVDVDQSDAGAMGDLQRGRQQRLPQLLSFVFPSSPVLYLYKRRGKRFRWWWYSTWRKGFMTPERVGFF